MTNTAKTYIIIVTYNAMQWAERCFTSLRNSSIPVSTIVIDNGSTDGTQEYIKINFPEVDFVQSNENLGFGRANNLGIEKAYKSGADFFYLMNQDAWIFPETFSTLLKVYEKYQDKKEIGIISPVHLDGTENNIEIFFEKYMSHNFEKNRMISDSFLQNTKDYYTFDFINAAHWFIPKHTIETVGGFNPYFFHYGEDNEYMNRVHYHNKRLIVSAKSFVVHDAVQELNKVNYNKYRNTAIETKLINPIFTFNLTQELKSYLINFTKNLLTFNLSKANHSIKEFFYLLRKRRTFITIRNKVKQQNNTFLNIYKK